MPDNIDVERTEPRKKGVAWRYLSAGGSKHDVAHGAGDVEKRVVRHQSAVCLRQNNASLTPVRWVSGRALPPRRRTPRPALRARWTRSLAPFWPRCARMAGNRATMATADQIKALLASHLDGDEQRFYTVAIQIAAQAARKGQGKLANEIRQLVDQAKVKEDAQRRPVAIASPRGELGGLLAVSYPQTRLSEMVLERQVRDRLERVIREDKARERIAAFALQPRRKLLLIGPPGSGKTMTARALAAELHLPLLVLRLDGLITKFMGETASKLRLVFDSMAEVRGVYLFDEFDAIGTQRGSLYDVGEIKRVLNSFLQFIEHDTSDSLLISATNHPQVLDRALFRRFDDIIEYAAPGPRLVERALRNKLAAFETATVDWKAVVKAGSGLSYAELTRACEDAAKATLLDGRSEITTAALVQGLEERRVMPGRSDD